MRIAEIKLYVLENPEGGGRRLGLEEVPGLRRIQYRHRGLPGGGRPRQSFLEVVTDAGLSGRCTTTMSPGQAGLLRDQVLGVDPLHRERLWQMLHKGTRWLYQPPGWFGDFDNCLWDIAGKAAGLPVYALVGKVRDRFPAYLTGGDGDLEYYLKHVEAGRGAGIAAYKLHSYKGGKADIPILRQVREAVGPQYTLIHDPVCSYDLREAIEVGHAMEELDFVWLEEPFHEQKLNLYQELCRELVLPVMANEMLMHDLGISTQWLIQGGTDRLRANARNGTTQVLKMAHFAEGYGTNVELNGQGGLFGLLHAHLGCCIDNTDYYECTGGLDPDHRLGEEWGLTNAPVIEDGCLVPPDGPGWGAEWDEDAFQYRMVEVH
ncbi:MAG: enolase C-terminal domain-like protein [Gemmatimonadota bacterium]